MTTATTTRFDPARIALILSACKDWTPLGDIRRAAAWEYESRHSLLCYVNMLQRQGRVETRNRWETGKRFEVRATSGKGEA